jgi:hypothetical protein
MGCLRRCGRNRLGVSREVRHISGDITGCSSYAYPNDAGIVTTTLYNSVLSTLNFSRAYCYTNNKKNRKMCLRGSVSDLHITCLLFSELDSHTMYGVTGIIRFQYRPFPSKFGQRLRKLNVLKQGVLLY